MLKLRYLLIYICFSVIGVIPWHVDIAINADVTVTPEGTLKLDSQTSWDKGIEVYRGQPATFFPKTDNHNPMYACIKGIQYTKTNQLTHIKADVKSHTPLNGTQKVQGILLIKGERKSLLKQFFQTVF